MRYLLAALLVGISLAANAQNYDPNLKDHITRDWVDLGHWTWYYPGTTNCQFQGCKNGEVYYSPKTIMTEPSPGQGITAKDVLVKIEWGADPQNAPRHQEAGGDNSARDFTLENQTVYWQIAFNCTPGANNFGMSSWYYNGLDSSGHPEFDHGHNSGPYTIQPGSPQELLKPIVCGQ